MQVRRFISWPLTRLLAREILGSFVLGTAIFLMIMLVFQAIRLSEFLVVHQAGLRDVSKISYSLIVSFVPIAVPVAFLFAVLMGISRANSEGEILALQLAGFSPIRIFAPLGLFSLVVAFVSVWMSLYYVPQANRRFELMVGRIDSERVMAALKPGIFNHGFYGLVLLAEQINSSRSLMRRVFIYDNRENTHPLTITAQDGTLQEFADRGIRTLRLRDGTIHIEKPYAGGVQQKINFRIYDINLEFSPAGELWRDFSAPSYTLSQLRKRLSEAGGDLMLVRRLEIELHRRYSLALSVLAFAVLGFAIGCRSHKGVRSGAIVLCLLVALVYWLFYLAATALAATGWILPWLGIWLPNFILIGVGVILFRRNYA
ncbi:MAG: LptF/LptG family permease [Deltaproteobacteria bacterium]|nr:LptF/LptG family permease [Deltaproteobacteria bacterium]MBI3293675.1 LptF/LptG family permease [Deltaproteobacteria bacterium]